MKTKKFNGKLVFNKRTIANLNNAELNGIKGGTNTYCVMMCPTPNSAICQVSFFDDCNSDTGPTCGPGTCY